MQTNHQNYVEFQQTAARLLNEAGAQSSDAITAVLFDYWLRGSTLSEIETVIKNAVATSQAKTELDIQQKVTSALKPLLSYEEKLSYVKDELERLLARQEDHQTRMLATIQKSDAKTQAIQAADYAEQLIDAVHGARVYRSLLDWLKTLEGKSVPAAQQYIRVFQGATKELAVNAASINNYSTSAQTNMENRAKVAAYGTAVDLFTSLMHG